MHEIPQAARDRADQRRAERLEQQAARRHLAERSAAIIDGLRSPARGYIVRIRHLRYCEERSGLATVAEHRMGVGVTAFDLLLRQKRLKATILPRGGITIVRITTSDRKRAWVGTAWCSRSDTYDRLAGRSLALERAVDAMQAGWA